MWEQELETFWSFLIINSTCGSFISLYTMMLKYKNWLLIRKLWKWLKQIVNLEQIFWFSWHQFHPLSYLSFIRQHYVEISFDTCQSNMINSPPLAESFEGMLQQSSLFFGGIWLVFLKCWSLLLKMRSHYFNDPLTTHQHILFTMDDNRRQGGGIMCYHYTALTTSLIYQQITLNLTLSHKF